MSDHDLADMVAVLDLFGGPGEAELAPGGVRKLTAEDMSGLGEIIGSETPPVQKMRETHHKIARLVAAGHKGVEIAAMTNYSNSRISLLKKDPAFIELVAYYSATETVTFLDMQDRLATLGGMAVDELRDRIEEGELSTSALIRVAELALDRSVAPPKNGIKGGPSGQAPTALPNLTINFLAQGDGQANGLPTLVLDGKAEEP